MPQNKFALARYRLIDDLLRKNDYVKTIDIVNACKEKLKFEVTQRTIQMDMEALKNDSFLACSFNICYCKRNKAYYYNDEPNGFFLAFCLSDAELDLLQELKITLENILLEENHQLYCDIMVKIENYLNIKHS